ncbi:MAG: glutamate mutase L [Anaerolineae bacterium]|nr:glutamate mutase L [Anaerolineae bacterium]
MTMAETDDIRSIIAADFGSVTTRAVLIDLVNGAYRMVARAETRTTADDPLRDVAIGLYRALAQISEATGRELLTGDRRSILIPEGRDSSGVDALLATASVGQPLRVVVVGLMPDVSVASARHVLSGSYVDVVDVLSLADVRTEEQQINAVLARKPDMVFIVGGTDAGAEAPVLDLVQVVRSAVQIAPKKPTVLYAGNRALQNPVRELLGEVCDLVVTDNVRPGLLDETPGSAQQGLAALYDRFKNEAGSGFDEVSQISAIGVLPTAQGITNLVRYLGATTAPLKGVEAAAGVLAVDVGSATTLAAAAIRRREYVSIRTDIGLGHSATGLLEATTPGNIRRWLTWDASEAEITSYAYNKALRPATVPQTEQELELEYALAREALRIVVGQARAKWPVEGDVMPPLRPIVGGGAVLANASHPGMAALLLLDAIQPEGVTELWLDPAGLVPMMGALGYLKPEAVVQMVDEGDLMKLGPVICASGRVRHIGRGGLRITIRLPDGTVERKQVAAGTLWTYPLPPGQTARVDISVSRGMSIGGSSRVRLALEGGVAGLIFDARGRPLPLPREAEVRAQLYPRWVAGTRGAIRRRMDEQDDSQVARDELGRVALETETEMVTRAPEQPPAIEVADSDDEPTRRGLFGFLRRRAEDGLEETDAADLKSRLEGSNVLGDVLEEARQAEDRPAGKQRRLFGRREARETEAETVPAPADEQPGELDELVDDLRASTEEAEAPPARRSPFRRG